MARRRINPRRVKIHRNYTVVEAAETLGAHENTIRNWLEDGLLCVPGRPTLIFGLDLLTFIERRREGARQKCRPSEMYCVRCRAPKEPAGLMADYVPNTDTSGNLKGICPTCERMIFRAVSLKQIDKIAVRLDIAFPHGRLRIRERSSPSLNCELAQEA